MLKKASRKKGVGASEDDPYVPILKSLIEKVNECNVRLENLRILLVKRGVFLEDDFEKELVETRKKWNRAFSAKIAQAFDEALTLSHRRLLDSHKGRPQ